MQQPGTRVKKNFSTGIAIVLMLSAFAGCDARMDSKTGSGSPENAASAAAASRKMDPR